MISEHPIFAGFHGLMGCQRDPLFRGVTLLAITAYYDYEIWQMDVKTAFLNGKLLEDVYKTQPYGFVNLENVGKVCNLQRSIY